MFEKKFEDRLKHWHDFREGLKQATDPVQATIDFWHHAPDSPRNLDPYDQTTWPDPWQMIEENSYCEFTKLLAVIYTLKLANLYADWQPIVKVALDKQQSRLYYMCILKDKVLGVDPEKSVHIDQLPNNIYIQKIIKLPELY